MTYWVRRQAAYFGFGAEIQVRDLASGNVVYREVLAFADTMPGDDRADWIGPEPDSIEGEEQDASS